jgi:hypothetical protein
MALDFFSRHHFSREGYLRTLAGLGGRVATVGTGGLLDVERPLACKVANSSVSFCSLLICVIVLSIIDNSSFNIEICKFATVDRLVGS